MSSFQDRDGVAVEVARRRYPIRADRAYLAWRQKLILEWYRQGIPVKYISRLTGLHRSNVYHAIQTAHPAILSVVTGEDED